ncbi:MAG: hypothetical protein M3500_17625 [Actinomycetota bacterium]|nr:hypothetical protein [Actinomycetota bacterium]
MEIDLWNGLDHALGAAFSALVVYVVTVVAVRLAGRRTLAQMSAFDVVVLESTGRVSVLAWEDDDGSADLYASVRDEAARPRSG